MGKLSFFLKRVLPVVLAVYDVLPAFELLLHRTSGGIFLLLIYPYNHTVMCIPIRDFARANAVRPYIPINKTPPWTLP